MDDLRGAAGASPRGGADRDPAPPVPPRAQGRRSVGRRAGLLFGALALGVAVGVGVELVAGTAWGYVALPLAVAALWWRFADPTQCDASSSSGHGEGPGDRLRPPHA